MSEPQTRVLFDAEAEVADAYKQTAIPWCTTHDSKQASTPDRRENLVCEQWWIMAGRSDAMWGTCVISTGGPDHKWWEDT